MKDAKGYDSIYITGGEPMLYPEQLRKLVVNLKGDNSNIKIYLYTALPYPKDDFLEILNIIDGCTVTLHNYDDRKKFIENGYNKMNFTGKKMR